MGKFASKRINTTEGGPVDHMTTEEKRPTFPYHEIWEDFSENEITIDQLSPKLMTFRARFRLLSASGSRTPMVETGAIVELMDGLELSQIRREQLAEHLYLVAGYYLGPEHLKQWQTDVRTSARNLRKIQREAGELSKSLKQISYDLSRAIGFLHEIDSNDLEPKSNLDTPMLSRQLADLERVAGRVVSDISNRKRGRTKITVRLNALRMAVSLVEAFGIGRVTISPGNKNNHEPHFTGSVGGFVRDFFKLIAPKLSERTLVQTLGILRRSET